MEPLERPIFVVAVPQSGTTFLYDALSRVPGVFALDQRVRDVFDQAEELRPAARGHDSNRRTAADASPETARRIREAIRELLADREEEFQSPRRLLDGAPRHALRIPFLDAVFPDALFVYVYRSPRDTIASMIEAWRTGDYVTYPNLPGWPGPPWSLLLVPGWRDLAGRRVAEIAAAQWTITTRVLLDDLESLSPERWSVVDFAALASDPRPELERLCAFLDLEWDPEIDPGELSTHVISPSLAREKRREENLQLVLPATIGLAERARDLLAAPVSRRPTVTPDAEAATRSVYTGGFADILGRIDASLLLSTGRTGKLVCVRHDGARVNTHFRDLPEPTALAVAEGEFVVAVAGEVRRYRDDPERIAGLPGDKPYDGCFVPAARSRTGIEAADGIVLAEGRLWLIPSGSGELAMIEDELGFPLSGVPPVLAEQPEASWRLTGLAIADGHPGYVTAVTGAPGERLPGEPSAGCVVELRSGEVVAEGLSLPRAPRWHDQRLLVLEAGSGTVCEIDLATGEKTTIAHVPGIARSLAVSGSLAFVGLSRGVDVEPSSMPDLGDGEERLSGVWIVALETGAILGYLRFDADVPEVNDLALLHGYRFPEVADAAFG